MLCTFAMGYKTCDDDSSWETHLIQLYGQEEEKHQKEKETHQKEKHKKEKKDRPALPQGVNLDAVTPARQYVQVIIQAYWLLHICIVVTSAGC